MNTDPSDLFLELEGVICLYSWICHGGFMKNGRRITVIGAGYVGYPIAVLLSQENRVTVMDINETIVDKINSGISPVKDEQIDSFLSQKELDLRATTDLDIACREADYIILALPTDLNEESGRLDCSRIEDTVREISRFSLTSIIVIKSTVSIGFTQSLKKDFPELKILFAPEFIRETKALHDNLYPSRIIIGCDSDTVEEAKTFAELLASSASKKDIDILYVSESEAESIKLFSNAYLAMRVSFFNEVDTFAENRWMNTDIPATHSRSFSSCGWRTGTSP